MDPQDNNPRSGRETFLTIILTGLFGGGFLLFLILVSGGFFFYVVLAVVAIGMVGYLHYLLWGQSLTREVEGEREEMELRERMEADDEEKNDVPRDRIQRRY